MERNKAKKEHRSWFFKGLYGGAGLALGFFGTALLAVTVSTMTSFQSGEVISSAKINENFAALKAAIESIPRYELVDSNDVKLADATPVGFLTETGYRVNWMLGMGATSGLEIEHAYGSTQIVYASENCKGTRYIRGSETLAKSIYKTDKGFYYISDKPATVQATVYSYLIPATDMCGYVNSTVSLVQLIPNDPAITGFDPALYTPPFRVVRK